MRVGIVAEGPGDIAVLRNILKGKLGLHAADTEPLRPKLARDETDLAAAEMAGGYRAPTAVSYSNWTIVLEECRNKTTFEDFLDNQLDEERLVVIHIDTAEAHERAYGVTRPDRKTFDYSDRLRALVIERMEALLGADLAKNIRYAIAIEETEAWLLTIHDEQNDEDTSARLDPKKRLKYVLERASEAGTDGGKRRATKSGNKSARPEPASEDKRRKKPSEYELNLELSRAFSDSEQLEACATRKRSLRLFLDSL